MTRRPWLLAALLCLACGGMMDIFIPELPIELPPERRVTSGKTHDDDTTTVRGFSEGMDRAAVRRHFVAQLSAGGWTVEEGEADDGGVTITATRAGEQLSIQLGGGQTPPTDFAIEWRPR